MKISATGQTWTAVNPTPRIAGGESVAPADGYGGTVNSVSPVAFLPGPNPKVTSSLRGLSQSGADAAVAGSLGWLAKLSGLGAAARDWVTGRTSRLEQGQKVVAGVLEHANVMARLDDAQLRAKTEEFRTRLAHGATLDEIQVEAYAVAREAARRATGRPDRTFGRARGHWSGFQNEQLYS